MRNEVCPSCGEFVRHLNKTTGFCQQCTADSQRGLREQRKQKAKEKRELEAWLYANADHLEHYTSRGRSLAFAVKQVLDDRRPNCICCGNQIRYGSSRTVFCRQTPECRRYSRRYIYLYRTQGYTKVEALAKIMAELA